MTSHAEDKINDFIKKHGYEGFLELFISNYLYELTQYILHSESTGKENISNFYYLNAKGETYTKEQIEEFEHKLSLICTDRANKIVNKLIDSHFIERIKDSPLHDPELKAILKDEIEDILSSIGREK